MMVMYPWQTVEDVEREQIEAEILTDAEFAQWLDEVYAEPMEPTTEEAAPSKWGEGCAKCGYTGEGWQHGTCGGDGWTGKPCPHCSDPTAAMTELEFLAYAADQAEAQSVEKTLMFAEQTLRAPRAGGWDLLPDWQREDYIGA